MATRAELEKQLATIQAGLLDFTAIGEEAYFKQTGQTKLTKKELPRYTDIYNPIYQATKNVQFSLAEDITTTKPGDLAFYTYNAERVAEQKAQAEIGAVEQANIAATKQEEAIKSFLATEKQTAQSTIFNRYLSSIMNPSKVSGYNLFEWQEIDLTTNTGKTKWNQTNRKNRITLPVTTQRGTTIYKTYVQLTPEELALKKQTTEAVEKIRFLASPTLQKTYADRYAQELQQTIKKMLQQEKKAETEAQRIQKEIDRLKAKLGQT